MSPYKFRGKQSCLQRGKWVYGDLIHDAEKTLILDSKQKLHFAVDPATVGQFTGLVDTKNKREIYEGDILEFAVIDKERNVLFERGKVVYHYDQYRVFTADGERSYGLWQILFNDLSARVVGNIHDNPDLAKTEKARSSADLDLQL